ncbi:MAG: hypothetical protein A2505_02775 [Deltaproteobacteria bacterium RIFOXYD12_FULL_55_16]|nr:MAG: hypothetical protein A2505_02775 [Deltaproteobacteria bacterium RIFOXYD12_FULL_55_16]
MPGVVSIRKQAISFEGKTRRRRKGRAYLRYVSIFRRLSNAAIGRKGRFRMDTKVYPVMFQPEEALPGVAWRRIIRL